MVRLAARIIRRRRPSNSTKPWTVEIVYAVTSLGFADVRAHRLAQIIRGHWHIENRLHWVRDVVFAEDSTATNIAAACRDTGRHPPRAADLLT